MRAELESLLGLLNPGGWIFQDAVFVAAQVAIDPAAMTSWLPRGLTLDAPGRATLFFAHYPSTSFGSIYNEVGLFVDVRHGRTRAAHCPWMLVDDDVALVLGREALGYPKKLGTIEIEGAVGATEGSQVRASATRRGVELVRFEGRVSRPTASAPPMLGRPFRNVVGSLGLTVQRLVAFTPKEEIVSAHELELTVIPGGSSDRDPLGRLGLGRVERAFLYRVHIGAGGLPLPVGAVGPLYFARHHRARYL